MCLVVLIVPGHSQIGMLLVWDEAFWHPSASSSPGQSGSGSGMEASHVALGRGEGCCALFLSLRGPHAVHGWI